MCKQKFGERGAAPVLKIIQAQMAELYDYDQSIKMSQSRAK